MRRLGWLSCIVAVSGFAGPGPSRVTFLLGGVLSGPYRLAADLQAGVLEEATPPAGVHGDGAGIRAYDMPTTRTVRLAPGRVREIRRLGHRVFRDGAYSTAACPVAGGQTMDALQSFKIVENGIETTSSAPAACVTADASALQRVLSCAARRGVGC